VNRLATEEFGPFAWVAPVSLRGLSANVGLQKNDVITAVDGTPVSSARDLVLIVGRHRSGDQISVTYTRNGTSSTANITLSAGQASQGV
jgi:putative serine protease PepD